MEIRRHTDQTKNLYLTLTENDVAAIRAGLARKPDSEENEAVISPQTDEIARTVDSLEFHEDSKTFTGGVSPRVARAMLILAAIGTASGDVDWRSWHSLMSFDESTTVILTADEDDVPDGDVIVVHNDGFTTTEDAQGAASRDDVHNSYDLAVKLQAMGYDVDSVEAVIAPIPNCGLKSR